MLHTGGGGDGSMWEEGGYVQGLSGFRCILIDHRGHGRSDKPAGVENHGIANYVGDVVAVLDTLSLDRAAFWGYSSGWWVGYGLAAMHPRRLSALVAAGAIGPRDYSELTERRETQKAADLSRRHGVRALIEEMEEEEGIAFPEWFWQQMTNTDREMFALQLLGAAEWRGPWSLLPKIAAPVLMLVGALEDPNGNNLRAAAVLRNGRSVTFPGLGHVGAYLRSDIALAHAVPFLKANTT